MQPKLVRINDLTTEYRLPTKSFRSWMQSAKTRSIVNELEKSTDIIYASLKPNNDGTQGTYAHPLLVALFVANYDPALFINIISEMTNNNYESKVLLDKVNHMQI